MQHTFAGCDQYVQSATFFSNSLFDSNALDFRFIYAYDILHIIINYYLFSIDLRQLLHPLCQFVVCTLLIVRKKRKKSKSRHVMRSYCEKKRDQ